MIQLTVCYVLGLFNEEGVAMTWKKLGSDYYTHVLILCSGSRVVQQEAIR